MAAAPDSPIGRQQRYHLSVPYLRSRGGGYIFGTPGGIYGQVQYNKDGEFGGSAGATFSATALTSMFVALGEDAPGDLWFRSPAGAFTRLPIGLEGQVLTVVGGVPTWGWINGGGAPPGDTIWDGGATVWDGGSTIWDGSVQGQAPAEIPGPFGVGVTPPADARPGTIFADNQMVLVPGQSLVPGGDLVAHLFYNAYLSTNDTINYLTNGPAYDFSFDSTSGGAGPQIAIRYAPPGTAGASVPWERIINFDPGVIMIDPVSIQPSGDLVGHILFNGLFNAALNNWVYFANGPAADFVYDATSQKFALRQAPPGTAGAAIPFAATSEWFGAPQGSGQTNVQLLTDEAGAVALQTVMAGPAGSGPGVGRALYVVGDAAPPGDTVWDGGATVWDGGSTIWVS
jgi:hypothetical protein